MNLYTYCANNPIFYIDPSGHKIRKTNNSTQDLETGISTVQGILTWGFKQVLKNCMEISKKCVDQVKRTESKKIGVKSFGIYASAMTGAFSFDGGVSIAADHEGNIVIQNYKGAGAGTGTPSLSAGISESTYWAKNYTYLEGPGVSYGGSGSIGFLSVGLDANHAAMADIDSKMEEWQLSDVGLFPLGATLNIGAALNSTVVGGGEGHVQVGHTETLFRFNYYEAYEQIYNKVMEW